MWGLTSSSTSIQPADPASGSASRRRSTASSTRLQLPGSACSSADDRVTAGRAARCRASTAQSSPSAILPRAASALDGGSARLRRRARALPRSARPGAIRESRLLAVDVSSLSRCGYTAEAIALHRAGTLDDGGPRVRLGIPVTSCPDDHRPRGRPSALGARVRVHVAESKRLITPAEIERALLRLEGRRGARPSPRRPPPTTRSSRAPDRAGARFSRSAALRRPRAERCTSGSRSNAAGGLEVDFISRRAARRRGRRGREPPHPSRRERDEPELAAAARLASLHDGGNLPPRLAHATEALAPRGPRNYPRWTELCRLPLDRLYV